VGVSLAGFVDMGAAAIVLNIMLKMTSSPSRLPIQRLLSEICRFEFMIYLRIQVVARNYQNYQ